MGKTKKERRKAKKLKLRNKRLYKKYPWLAPYEYSRGNWIYGAVSSEWNYDYLMMEPDMDGWMMAFFYDLQEGILSELKKYNRNPRELRIQEYKEKYGSMRLYLNDGNIEGGIVEKYLQLSENICHQCGRPDVFMTTAGWYLPLCKNCYEKTRHGNLPYEKVIGKNGRMADEFFVKRFSLNGDSVTTVSLKEEANRIRKRWNKKHPDDTVKLFE